MLPGDELRLGFLLLLNTAVLISAWMASRRGSRDIVQRITDALLVYFAVQYAAICLPGLLQILSVWTMTVAALLCCGALVWIGRSGQEVTASARDPATALPSEFIVAAVFVAAFSWAVIDKQAYTPVIDSDAMTYHVPAAVHWLQTGKLSLLPVWFFNPANTFSPLAGSTFIAWLIAPLGDDVLARMVQFPAVILLFFAALQIARAVGLSNGIASLIATAVAVSRPFNSEILSARDDVFLAAFIATAVAGCGKDALRDRFSPWRIGIAIGLAAATKYTFLFAAPVLLLLLDRPMQAGWKRRQWAIAIGATLVIASPWYLRNLVLTGNPLYPVELKAFGRIILPGLFGSHRSDRLSTMSGLYQALVNGFHSPPPPLQVALLAGWLAAMVGGGKAMWKDPLLRVCVFGFPLCLILYLIKSPYGEVRFLFPALVLVFIAVGMGIRRWIRWPAIAIGVAALLPVIALGTSYNVLSIVGEIVLTAVLTTSIVIVTGWAVHRVARGFPAMRLYMGIALVLIVARLIYVQWHAYVTNCQQLRGMFLPTQYPESAPAWQYISESIPPEVTLAYSNTYFIYPLYGTALTRRAIYVPVRPDVTDFVHLPHFPQPVAGEQIESTVTRLLNEHADRDQWLAGLLKSEAAYLYVSTADVTKGQPPEIQFADTDPVHFNRVFGSLGGVIYKIQRP